MDYYKVRGWDENGETIKAELKRLGMETIPGKGQTIKLGPMLDEYYQLRGWEKNTGFPTGEKLEELDLKEVADELENVGRLGV